MTEREQVKIDPNIFHAYDIRGLYPQEINPEAAYRVAWAFGRYLKEDLKNNLPFQVVVAQDMRGSSPFLAKRVVEGLNDQGIDVVEVGKVAAPAFYYAVAFNDYAGGMMVTASHMSKEYNGLKPCIKKAFPVAQGTGMDKIKEYALLEGQPKVKSRGGFSSAPNITAKYVSQDLSYLNFGKIKKFKIVADTANAMGATYLEELSKALPCDFIKVNWELNGNMPVHEANPIKLETLQQMQAIIKNEQADFGIATDGDGDRIAFLDEQADPIPSDIVTGLVAMELLKKYPGARIGYDLRSSRVVQDMIRAAGGEPIESKVGHSFVKALMKEKDILFSGELSGHYFFRENYNYESPVFVAAQLLILRSGLEKPFSEIWRPYKKYWHSGEINFEVADKNMVIASLEKKYADGDISNLDGLKVDYKEWWFNVRPSANDPVLRLNLEATDEATMKQKLNEVQAVIVRSGSEPSPLKSA